VFAAEHSGVSLLCTRAILYTVHGSHPHANNFVFGTAIINTHQWVRFPNEKPPPRSLVCDGQTGPHRPRLVVSRSTCPPLSPSPHAISFIVGPAVLNTHTTKSQAMDHKGRLSFTDLWLRVSETLTLARESTKTKSGKL
jgi:hypothetical protein